MSDSVQTSPQVATIKVKLPDGSTKEVPKGTTALDIAKSISPRLADAALAAKTNGDLIDLTRPLEEDTDLRILTERDPEVLEIFRHSSAQLLDAAVLELFPETKLGHGPATESGFFYDFYRPTPFTPEDLEKIEKKMQELVQQNVPYAREFLPRDQGLAEFKKEGGRGDEQRHPLAREATRPVLHSGVGWAGPDLLASEGRAHSQRDGRLDARAVPEARILAGVHAACGAATALLYLGTRGLLLAE